MATRESKNGGLKTRNTLSDNEVLHMLYSAANEPVILQEAETKRDKITS
jgi:hypothetical protein